VKSAQTNQQQQWKVGDVFFITLQDGSNTVGQIVGRESQILNSVGCALYNWRPVDAAEVLNCSSMPAERVFASLFTTRDLLDDGTWMVIGNKAIKGCYKFRHNPLFSKPIGRRIVS
jgi:hypothetical protein